MIITKVTEPPVAEEEVVEEEEPVVEEDTVSETAQALGWNITVFEPLLCSSVCE